MTIKKHIPNTITCGNLFCGCLALVQAFKGDLVWASYLVGIALILDFFDGFAARMLKVSSAIGKDLDSLADMVTFGVVPGVIMFQLQNLAFVSQSVSGDFTFESLWGGYNAIHCWSYLGFIVTIFSCIRLAKFNNDPRQSDSFIGLPTPANTMLICSLPLMFTFNWNISGWLMNSVILEVLSLVLSFLLVSELPLFSLKFKKLSWAGNQLRYVFLASSLVLLVTLQFVGIPVIIVLYLLLSLVNNRRPKTVAN
jgi:CDP-diacylglycerol--serine O-phosphatidyltransferase